MDGELPSPQTLKINDRLSTSSLGEVTEGRLPLLK